MKPFDRKYPFQEEVAAIWEEAIVQKRANKNLGYYATCCNTYLLKNRLQSQENHLQYTSIAKFLKQNRIKSQAKLIDYHSKMTPNSKPVVNKVQCEARAHEERSQAEQAQTIFDLQLKIKCLEETLAIIRYKVG